MPCPARAISGKGLTCPPQVEFIKGAKLGFLITAIGGSKTRSNVIQIENKFIWSWGEDSEVESTGFSPR